MPRIILLLAVLAGAFILYQRVQSLPPHKRRAEMLRIGIGVAVIGVVLLTLAGKMHWIGAALTGLLVAARQALPLVIRLFPFLAQWLQKSAASTAGHQSTVSTRALNMYLDHESGALSGEVRSGPWAEWQLHEMSRDQLSEFRLWCSSEDPESVQLLDGYLEQRFPGETPGGDQAGEAAPDPSTSGMSRREALQILGLDDDATEEAIAAAHRKLMQKLHPDRGGSDYLAAKINEAKDFLLG